MKIIERNLLTSAMIAYHDAKEMTRLIEEQPESKLVESRRESGIKKITIAQTFLEVLKMVACQHKKHGHDTGILYGKAYDRNTGKKVESFKEVTKRCRKCNQVFYRKRYNLMRKYG